MKKLLILGLLLLFSIVTKAQENIVYKTQKVWRVNFLNPAIEFEMPTGTNFTVSAAIGVGYGGGYPDLTSGGSGIIYIISPFLDLQQKWFYNFNKRIAEGKTVANNSGNFISARFITRGKSIVENVIRTSDYDFAVGPTWGFQRSYKNNLHLLFDIGPQYYFDTEGNANLFPIVFQINLGFDL
ncbi:MAG: hypothetical protein COB60_02155 [Flavobacteriaceae bacterium]|nr:MAG: hypothetical protein COB60_02155 [Flavobacteriaceae bacterium]